MMSVLVLDDRLLHVSLDLLERNFSHLPLNLNELLNRTQSIDMELIERFERNLRVSQPWLTILLVGYCILIVFGATGNCLLVAAAMRRPKMRTARNVFVINLAVSDLLLCLVTMPLTFMEVVTVHWPLGASAIGCKIVGTLQGTSVFVSTLSITAIALDRHQVIVNPTRKSLKRCGAVSILIGIWSAAMLISLPNFIWRTLETHEINLSKITFVSFCYEDWPSDYGRATYSAIVTLLQYCLPIATLTMAYGRICHRLRARAVLTTGESAQITDHGIGRARRSRRLRKTKTLLISISVIFCLSWLPLNVFNIVVDIMNPFSDTEVMFIAYALCHMIGMSSACSNPLLYGWLNSNFQKEFFEIFAAACPHCRSQLIVRGREPGTTTRNSGPNLSLLEIYPEFLKSHGRRCRRKEDRLREKFKRDIEDSSSLELRDDSSSFEVYDRLRREQLSFLTNAGEKRKTTQL